jgi:aryl-alcohol dehydrogenase-like predicted oxidoreductase
VRRPVAWGLKLDTRTVGGVAVSAIGLGCMNLSHAYGTPPDRDYALSLLRRALDLGVTHFDTAVLYGSGHNEELVGAALAADRRRIYLASKCGISLIDGRRIPDSRPATLQQTCLESLARLKTDVIDLYYLHRWDRKLPIEDSVGGLAQLITRGHIRGIGLSEVSADTIRRAHAVHPITAVQSEYSVWTRNPEIAVLEECRRLGIAFVAFSPLTRGFFAGSASDPAGFTPTDIRRDMPRFHEPHYAVNARLYGAFRELAAAAGCTPAQLCLAWLLQRGPDILPIPGTTSIAHLEENMAAAALRIDPALLRQVDTLMQPRNVSGARYNPAQQSLAATEEF